MGRRRFGGRPVHRVAEHASAVEHEWTRYVGVCAVCFRDRGGWRGDELDPVLAKVRAHHATWGHRAAVIEKDRSGAVVRRIDVPEAP